MSQISAIVVLVVAAIMLACWPGSPFREYWKNRRAFRQRTFEEDILKHICTRAAEGKQSSAESVAGALSVSPQAALRHALALETRGFIDTARGVFTLTADGETRARQILRAHRLWETYLAHEAQAPLARLHKPAEQAEHVLTDAEIERLDASLGHPRRDPHGDPIPRSSADSVSRDGDSLNDWPVGLRAEVTHVEDEPDALFRQATAKGLRPGSMVEVLSRGADHMRLRGASGDYDLSTMAARNVQVTMASAAQQEAGVRRLADLVMGEAGVVTALDPDLQGMTRRRLLDLGLTPGSKVEAYLDNAFGDPRAFRVRGTTIALRSDQAARIWIRPASPEGAA
jgi:DtxR family Mn-dependent transcriptional regulator